MTDQNAFAPLAALHHGASDLPGVSPGEVLGGRVLEITQSWQGELLCAAQLREPRGRLWLRLPLLLAGGLGVIGGLVYLLVGQPASGGLLLGAGVALLVAARGLRSRQLEVQNLATGWPLCRWSRARGFELLLPGGARGELTSAEGTTCFGPLADGQPKVEAPVAVPPRGAVRLWLGQLEVRAAWTRPLRPPPPVGGRPGRWLPRVSLIGSAVAHLAFLFLCLAVPPDALWVNLDSFETTVRRVTLSHPPLPIDSKPRRSRNRGPFEALLALLRGGDENSGDMALDSFRAGDRCILRDLLGAFVYTGHLRVTGPRAAVHLQRALRPRVRALESCYLRALEKCAGPGRLVLSIDFDDQGAVTRQEVVRSSWDPEQEGWDEDGHEDLVRCVREVVAGWKLTKTAAKQPSTL